jgi:hypothetical protein
LRTHAGTKGQSEESMGDFLTLPKDSCLSSVAPYPVVVRQAGIPDL